MSRTASHKWVFAARFRRGAFGWKSALPIQRLKEALTEIRQIARADPVLAADGAVALLEKLSPALEQVDSSSGAIGTAVNRAIDALVKIEASPVSETTRRDADALGSCVQRKFASASIWTDAMLAALQNGVKGGKWHSLIDKVFRLETLALGWNQVKKNAGVAGVDRMSVKRFAQARDRCLAELAHALQDGSYCPQPVRRVYIPKGKGRRPLGIPAVKDRVVQAALKLVIEPIFEHEFEPRSYGFRPGLGCKDALREVDRHVKAGYCWVVDADLQSYFDSIPHLPLLARVAGRIADGRVLKLIQSFLKQGDGDRRFLPLSCRP
ncbi:reverse transcriptase domain-containing protein [Paraburkholderia tuberum]|uniref:Group II intron reverse transcriptase/maturase n=1 Tax=Paraburkholderia tuberum TaxID=157910 RepID=A0A1H1KHG7_9BURK|nr:reverse transcriptase domain-containing protein [Paraburkholderia tuberum]SDR61522.1 group II intron reverse transcriptase/maturase [Paraburkholderia tuberum]